MCGFATTALKSGSYFVSVPRGVYPFQIGPASTVDELFSSGAKLAKEAGLAKPGDLIVITGGVPIGVAGSTNLLKVEEVD